MGLANHTQYTELSHEGRVGRGSYSFTRAWPYNSIHATIKGDIKTTSLYNSSTSIDLFKVNVVV